MLLRIILFLFNVNINSRNYCKRNVKVRDSKMKKKGINILHPIFVFILAQLAWLSLLGLWIYWYVSNYIILEQVGEKLSPQIVSKSTNFVTLIWGLILLVFVLGGMYLIFIYLTKQINLTRLYDNFIANVTHELKSPLSSIQLYLETMKLREVNPSKQKEFFTLMTKDINRLQNLINSILKISGLEQKKITENYHIYPAEEIVKEIIGESIEKYKLPQKSIEITGEAPCNCVLDRNALKIVFDNLIDNAMKFTTGSFQLIVQMAYTTKKFVLKFIDEGIGIPQKDQKKVFNKFYRIYGRKVPNIQGTGLGLHMVREIIKSHGGKITVYSEGENKGATFTIEFPIYKRTKKRYLNRLIKMTKKMEEYQYVG